MVYKKQSQVRFVTPSTSRSIDFFFFIRGRSQDFVVFLTRNPTEQPRGPPQQQNRRGISSWLEMTYVCVYVTSHEIWCPSTQVEQAMRPMVHDWGIVVEITLRYRLPYDTWYRNIRKVSKPYILDTDYVIIGKGSTWYRKESVSIKIIGEEIIRRSYKTALVCF